MKTKTFYTCGINWQHDPAIKLFDSVERLKEQKECWQECGIVKVEVVEKEWVEEQDLDGCVEEENPSFFTDPELMGYDPDDPEQQNLDSITSGGEYMYDHPDFYKAAGSHRHPKQHCVAYQEGGMGCPDCYCDSSCTDDSCPICGGNTPARIDEQIEWMEKKIAAQRVIEEHKDALQKLADNPIYEENEE